MFEMVKDGNIDGIKESLTEYIRLGLQLNIERKDKNRRTMLHWACYLGHKDIVDWIVRDQRLNLDEQDNEGYSALELAVIRGYPIMFDQIGLPKRRANRPNFTSLCY
jgi:ankyrin repeat protein